MKKTIYRASIALILFGILSVRAFADSEASIAPDGAPQTLLPIHISVNYPQLADGLSQSALKAGDSFSVSISSADITLHDVTADLHDLGLSESVPLTGSFGSFTSETLTLPSTSKDGAAIITIHTHDILGIDSPTVISVVVDNTAPEGSLQATFTRLDGSSGAWTAHLEGTYSGTGSTAVLVRAFTFGTNDAGTELGQISVDRNLFNQTSPTISGALSIPNPEASWTHIGFGIQVRDEAGNLKELRSSAFPIIYPNPIVLDHAIGGSIVHVSNYEAGTIPEGIGIPHTLLNAIPEGDYFAVVFFSGLVGCPSNNYVINSFRANAYWGYDVRGYQQSFSKAESTSAGGCMQEFHINPARGDDWLWGALSTTGTSSAIADTDHIPAFAICSTAQACESITPHEASTTETNQPSSPPSNDPPQKISSVLFLPGIKGSYLYEQNPLCLTPSTLCDIPLWPPLTDFSVPNLYLDASGKSQKSVYVKDGGILESAFGQDFYHSFSEHMNALDQGTSTDATWSWKPLAYDWRLSLNDLVENGVQRGERIYFGEATSAPYIEQNLRELASTSPTKKVTIIAHSNGGLVAKALMQKIGGEETSRLIDSVIFVGVPQSGAPQALASALLGDGESLPGIGLFPEFLMSRAHAREFALHSPMAYHLLPSKPYINAMQGSNSPLITFGEGNLLAHERSLYGNNIETPSAFEEFVTAAHGERQAAEKENLSAPAVLSTELMMYAKYAHEAIDSWQPPAGVEVYQIGGVDAATLSGIEFYEQPIRVQGKASSTRAYRPLFSGEGDGTVPFISSFMMNISARVKNYWVFLRKVGLTKKEYTHGTLFEMPEVETALEDILHGKTQDFVSLSAPPHAGKTILVIAHSRAHISFTDTQGRNASVTTTGMLTRDIPGSQAGIIGEDSYVLAPADTAYAISITNNASDSLILDVQELESGNVIASSTIASIPTSSSSTVSFTIQQGVSSMSSVHIDEDGNGSPDVSVSPVFGGTAFPPEPEVVLPPSIESHSITPSVQSAHGSHAPKEFVEGTSTFMLGIPETAHAASTVVQRKFKPRGTFTTTVKESPQNENSYGAKPPSLWSRFCAFIRELISFFF